MHRARRRTRLALRARRNHRLSTSTSRRPDSRPGRAHAAIAGPHVEFPDRAVNLDAAVARFGVHRTVDAREVNGAVAGVRTEVAVDAVDRDAAVTGLRINLRLLGTVTRRNAPRGPKCMCDHLSFCRTSTFTASPFWSVLTTMRSASS